jgi:hypothetical protein
MTAGEQVPGPRGPNVDVHAHLVPEAAFARTPRGLRANPMPERDEIGLVVEAPLDPAVQHAWCQVLNDELAAATKGSGHSRFLAALPDLDGGRPIPREPLTTQKGRAGGLLDKRGLGLPNYRSP